MEGSFKGARLFSGLDRGSGNRYQVVLSRAHDVAKVYCVVVFDKEARNISAGRCCTSGSVLKEASNFHCKKHAQETDSGYIISHTGSK